MARIISIHSFRGGTGKSNIAANVAALLADKGHRVGLVDTDIQSPGIHILFGIAGQDVTHTLNDYLWGKCDIAQVALDVTPHQDADAAGRVFLIPSSTKINEIARVLHDGYDIMLLTHGFRELIESLALDVLIIDTHPGLSEETLLSIVISHTLCIILRPDQQDYEGTGITLQVARELGVPNLALIVNKVPETLGDVKTEVEQTYNCPVLAVFPHSDTLMTLGSSDLFVRRYPDHPLTALYEQAASRLME